MRNKEKIIILMHYMELGGAEMSLIGLLHALDPEKVDVDLFIYDHRGPLMEYIPNWVNILPQIGAYSVIERPLKETVSRGYLGVALGRLYAKVKTRKFLRNHPAGDTYSASIQYVGDCVTPFLPQINKDVEYDLCISFLAPHNIGKDKVRAKKRLAWIHTDYSTVNIDVESELRAWGDYDHIASISQNVSEAFIHRFPSLASKIVGIENILPADFIKKRSVEFDASNEMPGSPSILSIGRFCTAKNYDNVPDIARRMVENGLADLKWYIIGSGIDESLIRNKISEAAMQEHVILIGKKDNPYPYIKACDVYIQPSRFEGKSITVREAQFLSKPVVITNYATAASQISEGVDGVIVPLDNEGCARGIADFIANKELQNQIVENLRNGDYAGESEVNKIYDLLR
ncbi:MAG: glycosyltransferase [Muribaculum sp.]|nr:glycosyltransferase [Muribaculum sp.]